MPADGAAAILSHGLAELMAAQRTEMAAQRTELAYQRNRFAADVRYMGKLRRRHRWLLDSEWGGGVDPMDRSLIVVSAIVLVLIGLVAVGIILIRF